MTITTQLHMTYLKSMRVFSCLCVDVRWKREIQVMHIQALIYSYPEVYKTAQRRFYIFIFYSRNRRIVSKPYTLRITLRNVQKKFMNNKNKFSDDNGYGVSEKKNTHIYKSDVLPDFSPLLLGGCARIAPLKKYPNFVIYYFVRS